MNDNDELRGRGERLKQLPMLVIRLKTVEVQRSLAARGCAAQPQTCLDKRLAVGGAGRPIMRAAIFSSQSPIIRGLFALQHCYQQRV
jgi:hypothetical protein